jgi:hypothetical protein
MEVSVRAPSGSAIAQVDDEDWEHVSTYRWSMAGGKGSRGRYAATSVKVDGRVTTLYMHRVVAHRAGILDSLRIEAGARGRWSHSIDHINGNKLDNRRANLRLLDRQQQMLNTNDGLRKTNTSGYRGVTFDKRRATFAKPWKASVMVNYKYKNLGYYATAEEASAARKAWDDMHAVVS